MTAMALATVFLSYLLGSIPSAYVAGRWLRGVDIREMGDGNPGAANTYRVLGPRAGITVGLVDVLKGAIPVFTASGLTSGQGTAFLAGAAAVAGHNWPLFLGFRGGRGASTTLGVLAVLLPREVALLAPAALLVLLVTRGGMNKTCGTLFAPLPFLAWALGHPLSLVAYAVALPCLVGITHYITTSRRARARPAT